MDEALLRGLNGLCSHAWVAALAIFFSSTLLVVLTCAPVAFLLLRARRYWAIAAIALAMGGSDAITARVLKPLFARERPCRVLGELERPVSCGVGESFPSGHATVAFAFLTSAAPVVPHGWLVLSPIAVGVALSRSVLGVHYPTDLLGGAAVGALIGFAFDRARRRLERDKKHAEAERKVD